MDIERTIEVAAPTDRVWAVMADVAPWPVDWLAPLIRLLYGSLARRYVPTEAASLKQRCEALR
jgi:hypothetical protein